MKLTLKDFLKLNGNDEDILVTVKEPNKCADYWTTLQGGKSNIHTDNDLDRKVYKIYTIPCSVRDGYILAIYVW